MASRATINERALAEVRRLSHGGRDGPDLLAAVVARLGTAIPFDFWCASTTDPASGLMTRAMASPAAADPEAARTFERLYFEHYHDEARAMAAAGRPAMLLAEIAGGDHRGSPRWRELLGPLGLGDELRGAFAAGGGLWGTADLARDAGARPFGTTEIALVRRAAPHVAAGLRAAALRTEAARPEPGPSAPGVLVLDRDGRVIRSTGAAEQLLADLEPLAPGWREAAPLAVRMVAGRLRRVLGPDADGDAGQLPRLRVRGRSGRWITLHGSLTEPAPDRPAEVVVVVEPARPEELAWLGPGAYGLTPREREIAALVARGASTDRIAATLHISTWTVQNHLSNVFDKVGVRNRPAMVRKLFLDHLYPSLFG